MINDQRHSIEAHPSSGPLCNQTLDESIRIRDRHQFEIKLNYPLSRQCSTAVYDLECYIFIPSSLGMNYESYPKEQFYQNLQNHIRFKTPELLLSEIAQAKNGPLSQLEQSIVALRDNEVSTNVKIFEKQLKLFCCVLQSSLENFVMLMRNTLDPDDKVLLLQQYIEKSAYITDSFRALRPRVFLPDIPAHAQDIYSFGDEYLSLLMERNHYDILSSYRNSGAPALRAEKKKLRKQIAHEVVHRQSMEYLSIPSDKSDNEQLIFRRNVLKKYMHNIMFLDTRTKPIGKMLEQGLFSIAAGISMLFATVILFASQTLYGPWSLPVFMALIIGYMFKDRIKDILRMYFSKKMMHVLFDRKTSIYAGSSEPIGSCIESIDFIDEDKAPDHILQIRNRDHITEIESDWVAENILRYRKRIKLTNQNILAAFRDIDTKGINDIMRFNISDFVRKMGNPKKELYVLTQDGFEKVKAERVYHITMILHYRNSEFSHLKRLRIILNRRKIKRIETVCSEEG